MKTYTFLSVALLTISSCSSTRQPNEVTVLDRPGQTEFTSSRHVRQRNKHENRDRVKYYNALQHKNHYKPQY